MKAEDGEEEAGKGGSKARGKRKPPTIDFDAPVSMFLFPPPPWSGFEGELTCRGC